MAARLRLAATRAAMAADPDRRQGIQLFFLAGRGSARESGRIVGGAGEVGERPLSAPA
jgi:hypothetical protein